MEYIYDDSNLISEPYEILVNIKDNGKSFISTSTSGSLNTQGRKVTPKKNVELLPDIKSMIDSLTDNSKIAELLKNKEEK